MKKMLKDYGIFISELYHTDKPYIFFYILIIILKAASPFALIIFPKYLLNEITGLNRMDYIIRYLIAMGATSILINVILNLVEPFLDRRLQHLQIKLGEKLERKILFMDYAHIEDPHIIDQADKAKDFIFTYKDGSIANFTFHSEYVCIHIIQALAYISILFSISPFMILAVLAVALLNAYFRGKSTKYSYESRIEVIRPSRKANYTERVCVDFKYAKEIRLFALQDWLLEKRREFVMIRQAAFDKAGNKFIAFGVYSALANDILQIGVYVYLLLLLAAKKLLVGDFTLYLASITNFSSSLTNIFTSMAHFEQIHRYLSEYLAFNRIPSSMRKVEQTKTQPTDYSIRFENVSFKYPGSETYALRNISITIDNHARLAVVGKNGAGKTTFVKLLMRLYDPDEGAIFVGGINIKDINYDEYMAMLSTVFQDFQLFDFTVKENIAFAQAETAEDADCLKLLEQVGLGKKMETLPAGIHTHLGKQFEEDGTELSGGEGQKLAIARAFYKKTPVVILDEPASALDPLAEFEIYKNFDSLAHNRTAIYISHRLSSTRFADNICVFDGGRIIQEGSHEALMEQDGLYKEMFEKQAHYYVEEDTNFER